MSRIEKIALPAHGERLLRPLPPLGLVATGAIVLIVGAAYCLGYEGLRGGAESWASSLVWSAYAVLPWLLLFEYVKRREQRAGEPLPVRTLALLLLASGAVSIGLEVLIDHHTALGLPILRRVPAIGATLLLLLLARRHARMAAAPFPARPESEIEALRRHAPAAHWIQAADNYLELHQDGRVRTLRLTMREAAAILEPLGFVRIHRSYIVNRAHVAAAAKDEVMMIDGISLPAGRAFAGNLRRLG